MRWAMGPAAVTVAVARDGERNEREDQIARVVYRSIASASGGTPASQHTSESASAAGGAPPSSGATFFSIRPGTDMISGSAPTQHSYAANISQRAIRMFAASLFPSEVSFFMSLLHLIQLVMIPSPTKVSRTLARSLQHSFLSCRMASARAATSPASGAWLSQYSPFPLPCMAMQQNPQGGTNIEPTGVATQQIQMHALVIPPSQLSLPFPVSPPFGFAVCSAAASAIAASSSGQPRGSNKQ